MSGLFGDMMEDTPPQQQQRRPQQSSQQEPATSRHDYRRQPYTMPFGKHKGTPIMDLEVDYLIWLWFKRDGEPLREPLAGCVRKALESYNIDPDGEMPQQQRRR